MQERGHRSIAELTMSFDTLGLPEPLVRAVTDAGYATATDVQAAAIPPALAGTDLMVAAATGSGKTASFILPALARILAARADTAQRRDKGTVYGPRILVLTPTRELAMQIAKAAATYGRHVPGIRITTVVGGVPYPAQLKARRRARTAGQLRAVGGVEHHRPAGVAHGLQAAHVHHQVVVAEAGPALREHHAAVARGCHLLRRAVDIVRRHELPLLDVYDAARPSGGRQQVRLAAEECGNLQNIGHLRRGLGLPRLVNIGQNGEAFRLHPREDAQPFLQARTAIRAAAGPVGLIETRLEDELAHRLADAAGHAVNVLLAFDHAGPGDQNQALAEIRKFNRHGRITAPQ